MSCILRFQNVTIGFPALPDPARVTRPRFKAYRRQGIGFPPWAHSSNEVEICLSGLVNGATCSMSHSFGGPFDEEGMIDMSFLTERKVQEQW